MAAAQAMRSRTELDFRAPVQDAGNLSQRILDNYRQAAQPVRSDYLEYLAQRSLSFADELEQRKSSQIPSGDVEQNTRAVVDRVYGILDAYALELNKILRSNDLFISATAPSLQQDVLEFDRARQPLKAMAVYRARFSTSRLSLVIRGLGNAVQFFLIPGDRIMGLSRAEEEIGSLMVFQSELGLTGLSWFVEAKPLTADRLERYSLLALEHLLDQTRQQVS
jgi:hypothetical protein